MVNIRLLSEILNLTNPILLKGSVYENTQTQSHTVFSSCFTKVFMLIYKALSVYAPAFAVRLEGVQQLSVDTISSNSVRVRWTGVAGARGYRVVWGPFTGQHIFEEFFFNKMLPIR